MRMKARTKRGLLDISKAESKRVQHMQQELVCGGRLTADRDEWRKECIDFGNIRYGNSANGQDEQKRRVRRHEDLLKKAKEDQEDQNVVGARISLADMMMGRADFKSGKVAAGMVFQRKC